MISKIISRAACLAELTSNFKSFFNCPDLNGGVPGLPEVVAQKEHCSVRLRSIHFGGRRPTAIIVRKPTVAP
jgi:hypothetical protein